MVLCSFMQTVNGEISPQPVDENAAEETKANILGEENVNGKEQHMKR